MSAVASDSHAFVVSSLWVVCWAAGLPADTSMLDMACGSGRHVRWLTTRGLRLTGIDHDTATLSDLAGIAGTIIADIEDGP